MSKWNKAMTNTVGGKDVQSQVLNKGASFLVAPHNMSFNKHAIKATEENHVKVIGDLNQIISKYQEEEAK